MSAPETARRPSSRQLVHAGIGWLATMGIGVLVVAVLGGLYAALPQPDVTIEPWQVIVAASVLTLLYAAMLLWSILRLQRSRRPVREGGVLITVLTTVFVLGYSWMYLSIVAADPTSFSQPLSKTAAVYFTVTVLATVGFGDIVPVTDTARMVVTSQMLIGLTIITLGIRVIVQSARTAAQRLHPILQDPPESAAD